MRKRAGISVVAVIATTTGLALLARPSEAQFPTVPSCPTTSDPTVYNGSALETDTTREGTEYTTTSGGQLELSRAGETFNAAPLTVVSPISYAATGDFNKDGWPDLVGTLDGVADSPLQVLRNDTWQNENCTTPACSAYSGPAPNWMDPALVVAPKFTVVRDLHGSGFNGRFGLAAGDLNGDGWDDVFEAYAPDAGAGPDPITALTVYLNSAANDAGGDPVFAAAYAAESGFTITTSLGYQTWSGTNTKVVDYNNDGRQDLLIGSGKQGGSIRILLNNCVGTVQPDGHVLCSAAPMFTDGGYLISDLNVEATAGFGTNVQGGLPVFDYADLDADGLRDLVVGAANCCDPNTARLRIFKGCTGGTGCTAALENVASQNIPSFPGAATAVFIADFSRDGKPDLVVATDGKNYQSSTNGGASFYYRNNGTGAPFSGGLSEQLTTRGAPVNDYDVGVLFDYDNDPTHSPDILVADGNDTSGFYVIADRMSAKYVDCGEASSGVLDIGALDDEEMVITAARVTPTFSANGGTITFYLSNEEPANWVQASVCTGSTTDYCVNFPKPVGRSVRWKVNMCSNAAHTSTPTMTGMSAKFDYTAAREHYRGGVVVNDGIAYVGAFHQPGDRGRFYAINAGLNTIYWDGSTKLDAMADASRKIYTSVQNLSVRMDFNASNATNALMQNLLKTPDDTTTLELINWIRSPRFGVTLTGTPALQKLGSVETSTPAVLTKPGRPSWYTFVTSIDRQRVETFIAAQAGRPQIVMFGAKDGMIHAMHTRPSDISNPINGTEAWAFIPPTVAAGMLKDFTDTQAANASANDGTNNPRIASYPDGSPTLVDFHEGNGVFKTVALVAEGNGGKAFTALDVTDTIDASTGTINGPTPMWSATPGDGEAGQAYSKPAVARVLINNVERYFVLAATGVDYTDTLEQKGRVVSAYDLANGTLMWKFQTRCPVTSDISVFETDDVGEDGLPTLNGYADRAVFADKCGYVYKVAPGVDLAGAWYQNTNMGSIAANTAPDGSIQYALFSTQLTSGALAQERPIAGTIAARTDNSTRMVLFFGTGGLENVDSTVVNHFYAVYSDTGAIRSKIVGTCNAAGACEKFYGGSVVTPEQIILTRTIDPTVGTNSCDPGSAKIEAFELNADASNAFVNDFTLSVSSAVMGGLYGDAGAIYFATLSGDVARIGTPRAPTAGADTASGYQQGQGPGDNGTAGQTVGTTAPFTLMGWRIVL
ncbi:MAG: FG-GAP-like repeat-containing protein [Kofleriaceae bacterium]